MAASGEELVTLDQLKTVYSELQSLRDSVSLKTLYETESGVYMHQEQTIDLNDLITNQHKGAVLVWCGYAENKPQNYNFSTFFIPKCCIPSSGYYGCLCCAMDVESTMLKYLYVYDDHIDGYGTNASSGTAANGVQYNNQNFVLVKVLGV